MSQNQTNIILESKLEKKHKKAVGLKGNTGTSVDNKQKQDGKFSYFILNVIDGKQKKDMKDDDWLNKLVKVKDDYERQHEENEKLRREIVKRHDRYSMNEQEY